MPRGNRPKILVASALLASISAAALIAVAPFAVDGFRADMRQSPETSAEAERGPRLDPAVTGSVKELVSLLPDAGFSYVRGAGGLGDALDALSDGDLNAVRKARDDLPATSLDRAILAWLVAMDGGVSSTEISEVISAQSDWPGMSKLHDNLERAIARENRDPAAIVEAFRDSPPRTLRGAIALARAHIALKDTEAARGVLLPLWQRKKLEAGDQDQIVKEFGAILTAADYRFRMEMLLYAERANAASRLAKQAGATDLAKAWGAVLRKEKKARDLLDAVPEAQRGAGYAFAEIRYLRGKKKYAEAAKAMLAAPRGGEALVDPDEWWTERRVLSRELVDRGDIATAYKLAATHSAEGREAFAEAEFHAGWYALRGLNDPTAASAHFRRIAEMAEGPITRARAFYWLGRAAEVGGPGDAQAFYRQAAHFGTAFYGQLAAAKLGQDIEVTHPAPTKEEQDRFSGRQAVAAIVRLESAGYAPRAAILYRELAQQLENPAEIALLAQMAERRGDHYMALRIGKLAAARGVDVGALAHPLGAIPPSADISGAGEALAYAIARQESEFNVAAVSHAGARGLLQLLPGTAKEVAAKAGLTYSAPRLTTDAAYNATLGAAFLDEQLDRFSGSYILTFVGYNAGPSRAKQWIKRYGDPRGKDIETVVDWIERIPFTETRSYVQRVMENYQVYKTRLAGRFDIASDLTDGR
jgi:soluble lytic murein transglycosylase